MGEEKQSISSEEVGSVEDVLGKNDPILRPVSTPEPELVLEPGPKKGSKAWVEKMNKNK